jgi:hypothetical protein
MPDPRYTQRLGPVDARIMNALSNAEIPGTMTAEELQTATGILVGDPQTRIISRLVNNGLVTIDGSHARFANDTLLTATDKGLDACAERGWGTRSSANWNCDEQ